LDCTSKKCFDYRYGDKVVSNVRGPRKAGNKTGAKKVGKERTAEVAWGRKNGFEKRSYGGMIFLDGAEDKHTLERGGRERRGILKTPSYGVMMTYWGQGLEKKK